MRRRLGSESDIARARREGANEILLAILACPAVMGTPELRDEVLKLAVDLGFHAHVRYDGGVL